MKSVQEQLLIPDDEVFLLKRHQAPAFTRTRHHHRELEIKYMLSGSGKGFVGETVYAYEAGDLVLVGPNLPHHWVSDHHYEEKGILADCFYLQFREEFLGDAFLQKKAAVAIALLFQRARGGVRFMGHAAQKAAAIIVALEHQTGMERLLGFMELLNLLAESYQYKVLSDTGMFYQASAKEQQDAQRLNKIYRYIYAHSHEEIKLAEIAAHVNMSKPAFCTYFKHRTLKSFTEFVNEVRITQAQKLLIENELTVKEIAYEVGYNNISLFNRIFKKVSQMSPKNYQKTFVLKG